jgi:hypothetical protein
VFSPLSIAAPSSPTNPPDDSYLALTPDDRRLLIDCTTLNEALALAAAHLDQNVLPVGIVVEE